MDRSAAVVEKKEEKDDEPPNPARLRGYVSFEEISEVSGLSVYDIKAIDRVYPVKISRHYFSLIKEKGDGIYRQCIPSFEELEDKTGEQDPLREESEGLPESVIHRYPDRLVLYISNHCAMNCRFCTRKRKVGDSEKHNTSLEQISEGLDYIREHREVRDVLLSGGDPLMLSNKRLEDIVKATREISHVEIIRIGTRIPCSQPSRINPELCEMLKKYHPLYMNIHFNHPDEITPESTKACSMLADAGIPLGSQTVLLRGVNDTSKIMKKLMQKLLKIRVRPYYIYQCDPVEGTRHLRTRVETGLNIIEGLRGWTSGLCVPHFVIDAPGGGGKIPLLPEYVLSINEDRVVLRNYENKEFEYLQVD
jgi:lysine 2,3-aminomutase